MSIQFAISLCECAFHGLTVALPILQLKKLRFSELENCTQGHITHFASARLYKTLGKLEK